jgi:hypothetical protein
MRIVMRPAWVQSLRWSALVTLITVVVVVGGGTLVWLAERHATASNLRHWGDCLWWSACTLSTVGYGEHFPVTLVGRLIAVAIMACGVAIIGAVAAVVAFAFANRLTVRLEAAVQHMENQVEHVEAEMESVNERVGDGRPLHATTGLRELVIGVADGETAGSLTWLLARLGWHPEAGDNGVAWRDGGIVLRVAVRPWDTPFGVQGRLTFGAGTPERLARIGREATRHGFHRIAPRTGEPTDGAPTERVPARATSTTVSSSATAAASAVAPAAAAPGARRATRPAEVADGKPITLRATSGFEVVLVIS